MAIMSDIKRNVLSCLDRDYLVDMTTRIADIVSLTGEESPVAEFLGSEMTRLGMEVSYQEVEEGRLNAIGILKGSGGGPALMFCGHTDHFDGPQATGVADNRVYGRGLVNMKCAFPCYLMAVQMLVESGIALKGDVIVSGVVGEIEKAQVGRFHGKGYRGGGVGARYLMDHGVTADMCIIGEPTGLMLQIGNCGLVWAKVTVEGPAKTFVLKAAEVARAIQAWEPSYQLEYSHPLMLPTIQVGAVDGGNPFKPGTNPTTDLYVSIRILPDIPPLRIQRKLEEICAEVEQRQGDIKTNVELYLSTTGYEISADEPIVQSLERVHRELFDADIGYVPPLRYGITTDASRLAQYGVPAVSLGAGYGMYLVDPDERLAPGWEVASGRRPGVGIENLVNCTKLYALCAVDVCTKSREELAV